MTELSKKSAIDIPDMHEDEWVELVDTLRGNPDKKLPGRTIVTPEYLTAMLGYDEAVVPAIFAELKDQHVIADEASELGWAVLGPEDYRRAMVAAGQTAVGSMVEDGFFSRRKRRKLGRYGSPVSWNDVGDIKSPVNPTTHIRLTNDAPTRRDLSNGNVFERRKRENQALNDPLQSGSDGEYLLSKPFWPKMIRKVAAAAQLAIERKSDVALLDATALGSVFDKNVSRLDAGLIAGDAYARLIREGVLQPILQKNSRTGGDVIARYKVLVTKQEILDKYGVTEADEESEFEDGDEPWREIARNPANAKIFNVTELAKIWTDMHDEIRPELKARLDAHNVGKAPDDRTTKLPKDEYNALMEPVRLRRVQDYLDKLGVDDPDSEIADAVSESLFEANGIARRSKAKPRR